MTPRSFQIWPPWPQALAIAALVASVTSTLRGEPMQVVVPNGYANAEAAGAGGWPERIRAQYIYRSDQFDALPGYGGYLTSLRWRPDGTTAGDPPDWTLDELTISASVTERAPNNMDLIFANNVDVARPPQVVRAAAVWQGGTQNVDADGQPGGPRAFDIEFSLDTPFYYNPADGNLLLDTVGLAPAQAPVFVDRLADGDKSQAAVIVAWNWPTGSSLPAVAMGYVGGMIMEMSFVALPGDYNHDTIVDALDYDVWRAAYGSTGTTFAGADGNGDGIVDAADYTVWRDNFGSSVAAGGAPLVVPEPASVVLAAIAAWLLDTRRRAVVLRSR